MVLSQNPRGDRKPMKFQVLALALTIAPAQAEAPDSNTISPKNSMKLVHASSPPPNAAAGGVSSSSSRTVPGPVREASFPPGLIESMIKVESNFNPNAWNRREGSRGLCQIRRAAWYEGCRRLGVRWSYNDNWRNPERNRAVGEAYLDLMRERTGSDRWEDWIAAYNCGFERWKAFRDGRRPLPKITRRHLAKIERELTKGEK